MSNNLIIGWGEADITPNDSILLNGQFYRRFADTVDTPLKAIASVFGDGEDRVIWVACDLLSVPYELTVEVAKRLSSKIPDITENQIILSATHIHAGPFLLRTGNGTFSSLLSFRHDGEDILLPEDIFSQVAGGIVNAILEANSNKRPSYVETSVLRILTGYNRRCVYSDGTAEMYGSRQRSDFVGLEGCDGGPCSVMYVYNKEDSQLSGIIASVPCTAQVLEHVRYITSDYWGYVRENIQRELGENVTILGLCSSAGDLSPRDLISTMANEPDMNEKDGCKKLAQVLSQGFIQQRNDPLSRSEESFTHKVSVVDFPLWQPTKEEYEKAEKVIQEINQNYDLSPKCFDDGSKLDYDMCIRYSEAEIQRSRYSDRQQYKSCAIHALRIGNAVFLTNPFELFIAYGIRIRAALPGVLLFDSQLTVDNFGYLPTKEGAAHKGYSGMIFNGITGPTGGDLLVEKSISLVKDLYLFKPAASSK